MSLLTALREAPEEEKPPRRTITVLDPEEITGAPKLEADINYMGDDEWNRMAKKFQPGLALGLFWVRDLPADKRETLLKRFCRRALNGMPGLGRANLPRISSVALKRPAEVAKLPDVFEWTPELSDEIAITMDHEVFVLLQTAVTDRLEFATAQQEKKVPDADGSD